jgi:hypothetical protein
MLDLEEIRSEVAAFKKRYGLQDEDEHVIAAIHLINTHKIHPSLAQDQTSHGGGDNGIDGWCCDENRNRLSQFARNRHRRKIFRFFSFRTANGTRSC